MIPQHILKSFYYDDARKLNKSRINHLSSLNIDFNNKKVLETGCGGCGDITNFLLSKNAHVTLNDYRKENIESLMININKVLPFNTYDLNLIIDDIDDIDKFDTIVCYGTLYHLTNLENAFINLSNLCNEFVIISTCTSGQNNENKNIVFEGGTNEQSHNQYGSRPGRLYIWNQLNKHFKFVYTIKTQPDHIDYPLHFPCNNSASRNIFIGSHIKLENDNFVNFLLNDYEKEQEKKQEKEKLIFIDKTDGFGSQFQSIIFYILYSEFNNLDYIHKKIKIMDHNYNADVNFIEKANNCMNIQGNYDDYDDIKNIEDYKINTSSRGFIYEFIDQNVDLYTTNNPAINKIKKCFWENKDRDCYKNNKFNIAVHVRRPNIHDDRIEGTNTEDSYYLNVINHIREKYKNKENKENKDLCFHIYSQGNIENYNCYKNDDVILHIDEDVTTTFIGLVGSDILVTSASSFSYIAAILTDAEVYYLPFWHKPKKDWIIM